MKFFVITTALFAASVSAGQMRACSSTNMNGNCVAKTALGKTTGSWKSYVWQPTANTCVKVCNSCTELGWRCGGYSNNNINFNKFILFKWYEEGDENTATCC